MIALCNVHHAHADGGSFPKTLLRNLKLKASAAGPVSSRLPWSRERTLFQLGSNWAASPVVGMDFPLLTLRGISIIESGWRDGFTSFNVDVRRDHDVPLFNMVENDWVLHNQWDDFEAPPQGRSLFMNSKAHGIWLRLEFSVSTTEKVDKELGYVHFSGRGGLGPMEVAVCKISGHLKWPREVGFTPTKFTFGKGSHFSNCASFGPIQVLLCRMARVARPSTD